MNNGFRRRLAHRVSFHLRNGEAHMPVRANAKLLNAGMKSFNRTHMRPSNDVPPVIHIVIGHRHLWPGWHYSPDMAVKHSRLSTSGDNAYKYLLQFYSASGALQSELLVKQYHANWITADLVENEFRGLQYASEVLSRTAQFRAPFPFGRSVEHKLLVMEYCPCHDLSHLTFAPIRFSRAWLTAGARKKAFDAISRTGELLAAFQSSGVNVDGSASGAVLARYLDLFENNITAHKLLLPRPILAAVQGKIRSTLTSHFVRRLVPEHHDFGPWNVTVGARHWFLFDFGNFTHGCPEYDLARFTMALRLYSQHRTVDERLVDDLQVLFIDSFRRSTGRDTELDAGLFRAFALMHLYELARVCLSRGTRMQSLLLRPSQDFFAEAFEEYLAGEPASIRAVRCADGSTYTNT